MSTSLQRGRSLYTSCAAIGLLVSLAFAIVLAVSPQLHQRIHIGAGKSQHECAVTLIASGKCEHAPAAPLIVLPQPIAHFTTIPTLSPLWVPALFLGASVFEHAPPALS